MNIFDEADIQRERSSTGMNGLYFWSQLMLNILREKPRSERDRDKFVFTCAKWLKNNPEELKKLESFNVDYDIDSVLEWYTKDSFLYRTLNRAFRSQNIELLLLLQFYICDLYDALNARRCSEPVCVYRGQLINTAELRSLENSVDKYVSMNSFLSTSRSRDVAYEFLGTSADGQVLPVDGFAYVIFEIQANPQSNEKVNLFADISKENDFEESEILFLFGAVFRIDSISKDPKMPSVTIISMTLCGADTKLEKTLTAMKTEYLQDGVKSVTEDEKPTLIALLTVLINMGHLSTAKKLAFKILKTLQSTPDSVEVARCYFCIGDIYRQKNAFRRSRWWYKRSLKILTHKFPLDNSPLIAAVHMSLGHSFSKITDWKFATWYQTDISCKSTLEIKEIRLVSWKTLQGSNHALVLRLVGDKDE